MTQHQKPGLGAFHPVIFFLFVYGISLFMALFVCRAVYYSVNEPGVSPVEQTVAQVSSSAVVMR